MEALQGNLEECQNQREQTEGVMSPSEVDSIRNLERDVEFLNADNDETIELCRQYLGDNTILDKSPYRRMIARAYWKKLDGKYSGLKQQNRLRDIISFMEENILSHPDNGSNIRIWFNAIRNLEADNPTEILESALDKLEGCINSGNAPAEAYFYRYMVRFIRDEESGAIDSKTSTDALTQCLVDLKTASAKMANRTITLLWLGNDGLGLQRWETQRNSIL